MRVSSQALLAEAASSSEEDEEEETGEVKKELSRVVGSGTIDGAALSDLLDRAVAWAEDGLRPSDDPKTEKLIDAVKMVLDGFSGKRYVQSMDAGFSQFLNDFYNDRIK